MEILKDFLGGNIRVVKTEGNTVYLENDQTGSIQDWFYWSFCVKGAQNETWKFQFTQKNRVGYWGPAVSKDLKEFHWLNQCDGESFTYTFGKDEDKVYFSHDILYHPDRFLSFAKRHHLKVETFCKSQKGREMPCLKLGEGKISLLLTARHHACEATGSYVLEGVLDSYLKNPLKDVSVLVVPFVDYDGVVDGDQGKSRAPHDHNRDYIEKPIYEAVATIQNYVKEYGCHYAFDFHSPWHKGEQNDLFYIVQNSVSRIDRFHRFATLLENSMTKKSMQYRAQNDMPPNLYWNQPSPNFPYTMMHERPECVLAFSLESPYFGTIENKTSEEGLLELGHCFYKAMQEYINETKNEIKI